MRRAEYCPDSDVFDMHDMQSHSETTTQELQRHSTLYILDGDIALSAPKSALKSSTTSVALVFRVHRRILSYHSVVFSSILSIPVIPDSNETYDGVPLVRLTDDADDFESLLKMMYIPSPPDLKHRDPGFPIFAGKVLKIADKYEVDSVRHAVVKQLESDWPKDLSEWYRFKADMEKQVELNGLKIIDSFSFNEPASAIRVAMDHDIPSILPIAFYTLAQADMNPERPPQMGPAPRWDLLNANDFVRLMGGKQFMAVGMNELLEVFIIEQCSAQRCGNELTKLKATKFSMRELCIPDPLGWLYGVLKDLDRKDLCSACQGAVRKGILKTMEICWRHLPRVFEL